MSNRVIFGVIATGLLAACGGPPAVAVNVNGPVAPAVAVAVPIVERTLIRGGEKDKLFIILNGQRRLTDARTVDALGIAASAPREVGAAEFAAIPEGKPLKTNFQINKLIPQELTKLQNRTLIRAAGSPRIYIVCLGQRHWVDDRPTFVALGLNPNEIVTISPEQMVEIPEGPVW